MIQDPTTRTPEELGGAIDHHLRRTALAFADAYGGDTLAQAGDTLAAAAPFVSDEVIGMVQYVLDELRAARPS
jgi:stage V sporulation protein SpoVS